MYEAYLSNLLHVSWNDRLHYLSKSQFSAQPVQQILVTIIDRNIYYLGPLVEILLKYALFSAIKACFIKQYVRWRTVVAPSVTPCANSQYAIARPTTHHGWFSWYYLFYCYLIWPSVTLTLWPIATYTANAEAGLLSLAYTANAKVGLPSATYC